MALLAKTQNAYTTWKPYSRIGLLPALAFACPHVCSSPLIPAIQSTINRHFPQIMTIACINFVAPLPLCHSKTSAPLSSPTVNINHRTSCYSPVTVSEAQFSYPLPQTDPFAFPSLAFPPPPSTLPFFLSSPTIQPDLPGALLWTAGLYLGFSQKIRWSTALRALLYDFLTAKVGIPLSISSFIADALHWVPFLAAGLLIDSALHYAAAGNAAWALSTGTTIALYSGIFELARQNVAARFILLPDEQLPYEAFQIFAHKWLQPEGRCHFIDVKAAVKKDTSAPMSLRRSNDEMIRKFVRNQFPGAKRSSNGYYRGLSVRKTPFTVVKTNINNISSSSDTASQCITSSSALPSSSSTSCKVPSF